MDFLGFYHSSGHTKEYGQCFIQRTFVCVFTVGCAEVSVFIIFFPSHSNLEWSIYSLFSAERTVVLKMCNLPKVTELVGTKQREMISFCGMFGLVKL